MPVQPPPDVNVLVALHYQNDILHPDGKIRLGFGQDDIKRQAVLLAAQRLLEGARATGIPVIHVRIARSLHPQLQPEKVPIFRNVILADAVVEGEWGSDFFSGLGPEADETVVTHTRVNGFYDSALEMRLRQLGATHLVLAGVATNSCVEHTARHAADMGYAVTVAQDACSAARPEVHEAALFNIGLIGSVRDVDDLIEAGFQ